MKTIVFALLLIYGSFSFASVLDVNCQKNGCLKQGWTISQRHFVLAQIECTGESCDKNGWQSFTSNNQDSEVICNHSSCFSEGWSEITPRGDVLGQTECKQDPKGQTKSCAEFGWVTYFGRNGVLDVTCLGRGCFKTGWESFRNGVKNVRVLCKTDGCFESGWTIYQ